jgi:hypothetical protein
MAPAISSGTVEPASSAIVFASFATPFARPAVSFAFFTAFTVQSLLELQKYVILHFALLIPMKGLHLIQLVK